MFSTRFLCNVHFHVAVLSLSQFFPLKDITLRFSVTVDGHFLTKPVDELFHKHELLSVPFMTGVNNDEGGWLLPDVSVNAELLPDICVT